MPAKSAAQQKAMAIAEHDPAKLYGRNAAMKKMSQGDLHDFAATKASKLPYKVAAAKRKKKNG